MKVELISNYLNQNKTIKIITYVLIGLLLYLILGQSIATARESQSELSNIDIAQSINNLWVLVSGIFVLSMQLGFAMIEAGFNAHKNIVNVLFKT